MDNADILRIYLVELVDTMRGQVRICDKLIAAGVLTTFDKEDIMCERTNSARNRTLVGYIRQRFKRGFPVFCQALLDTRQDHLVELLCPRLLTDRQAPQEQPQINEPVGRELECSVCMNGAVNTAFIPCGHSLCDECAGQIQSCHHCRQPIEDRLTIYL